MPRLLTLLLKNLALGFAVALLFVGLLIWSDTAGLGRLVAESSHGWLAAALLAFFTGLTFASVQMGVAVMGLGKRGEDR